MAITWIKFSTSGQESLDEEVGLGKGMALF